MHCGGSPLLRRLGLHSASSVHLDEPFFQLNGGGTPCWESPFWPVSRWRRHRRPSVRRASSREGRLCLSPLRPRWPPLINHLHWVSPGCLHRHPLSPSLAPSPLRGGSIISRPPCRCGLTFLICHYNYLSSLLDDNVEGLLSLRMLLSRRRLQTQGLL